MPHIRTTVCFLAVWFLRSTEVERTTCSGSLHVSSTAEIVPRLFCAFHTRVSQGSRVHWAIFSLMYPDLGSNILHPFPRAIITSLLFPLSLPPLLPCVMCFYFFMWTSFFPVGGGLL